jgi:excisionase family DNA binding protein
LGAEGPEGERSGSPHADGSDPEILSVEAASAQLGISKSQLLKLISGRLEGPTLRHARAGRRILIRQSWLNTWLNASAEYALRQAEKRKADSA